MASEYTEEERHVLASHQALVSTIGSLFNEVGDPAPIGSALAELTALYLNGFRDSEVRESIFQEWLEMLGAYAALHEQT